MRSHLLNHLVNFYISLEKRQKCDISATVWPIPKIWRDDAELISNAPAGKKIQF